MDVGEDIMNTLEYILKKFNIMFGRRTPMPIEIPNFGRDNLATLFAELEFKTGAEVGVETGAYSETLLKNNPGLKLYSIDPWKAYIGYQDHTNQDELNSLYKEAKARLALYKSKIIRKFSKNAVKDFADNSLDFVYIDANHSFLNIAHDIIEWSKKVKVGGIVSGHDYVKHRRHMNIHVKQVVNAYTDAYSIKPWFVLGTYEEIPGQIRDNSRSWMWVKT